MFVKDLIKLLQGLDQDAVIDIASDEEGNCFGDISNTVAEGVLKETGKKCYSLYPENCQDGFDRYVI